LAFDVEAATAAYIDAIGADALAKSAAYTAGSHWLVLWGFVVSVIVAAIVVRTRVLERIEARLRRRGPNLRVLVVSAAYFIIAPLLTLPWSFYSGWWREMQYGHTSQPFADALVQSLTAIVITAVLASLFFMRGEAWDA
jgi:STE24 endopeptidase